MCIRDRIDGKLTQIKDDGRARLAQVVVIPTHRGIAAEHLKNVMFDGVGEYPMEFLKELEEIRTEYYPGEGINWVARNLEGEAVIWWKLVKNEITTFQQFQDVFISKYWNQLVHEAVRDRLEYGKYSTDSGLSMIQYMEKCILQNHQLIPPISDKHLIRKIARHYSHDITVATLTRGVSNITEFQYLLMEFTACLLYTSRCV